MPDVRPAVGIDEIDGIDLRQLNLEEWRARVAAVFQDFIRFELSMRENIAPRGGSDASIEQALVRSRRLRLGRSRHATGQRLRRRRGPLGRPVAARRLGSRPVAVSVGAGLVLLDEPTAQLDVRGEAEIFERVLTATRNCTTILVSHRFSTFAASTLFASWETAVWSKREVTTS